jgi:hypothetical protein
MITHETGNDRDPVELEVKLHHETAPDEPRRGAVLVSLTDEEGAERVWIAKSQAVIEGSTHSDIITITIPTWLALEKGLI